MYNNSDQAKASHASVREKIMQCDLIQPNTRRL